MFGRSWLGTADELTTAIGTGRGGTTPLSCGDGTESDEVTESVDVSVMVFPGTPSAPTLVFCAGIAGARGTTGIVVPLLGIAFGRLTTLDIPGMTGLGEASDTGGTGGASEGTTRGMGSAISPVRGARSSLPTSRCCLSIDKLYRNCH